MMAAYLCGEILADVCMTSFTFHCCAGLATTEHDAFAEPFRIPRASFARIEVVVVGRQRQGAVSVRALAVAIEGTLAVCISHLWPWCAVTRSGPAGRVEKMRSTSQK